MILLRMTAALVLALVIAALPLTPAEAGGRTIKRGNSFEFQLEGNPSTGYVWRLNVVKSSGMEAIELVSIGYRTSSRSGSGKVVVGAPAPFYFQVTCVKEGFANLIFDYVGPSGSVARSHETWIRCD